MNKISLKLNFKKFLYHSEVNVTETAMLNEENIVFFFHLLGIDTNGNFLKYNSFFLTQ